MFKEGDYFLIELEIKKMLKLASRCEDLKMLIEYFKMKDLLKIEGFTNYLMEHIN